MLAQNADEIEDRSRRAGLFRAAFRKVIHFLSYHFVYEQRRTRFARAAGFDLVVHPTVFHPRWFLTSEFFASFIGGQDLAGQRVADVGTGSGILALAAARAGAERVTAIDVNPQAVRSASENAERNGLGDRVTATCSNLFGSVPASTQFDLIISSPPSFSGEPLDVADRAWHAGPEYRDIRALFDQSQQRLAPEGRMLVLLSSDTDIEFLEKLWRQAGFEGEVVGSRSIMFESFPIYELRRSKRPPGLHAVVAAATA